MKKRELYFQSSHKLGNILSNLVLVIDALYLNPFANFKQWYTPYEKQNQGGEFSG